MNAIEIVFLVGFIIFVSLFVFFVLTSIFRYDMIIKKNSYMQKIITSVMYKDLHTYNINFSWWTKQSYSIIKTKSKDGLTLVGYYIKNEQKTNKTALLIHGYGSNAFELQSYCEMFLSFGYNVLAVDNRGHGKSEGKIISMGYYEKQDIGEWVKFLIRQNNDVQIVVFGISMGGASVCLYSGEKKPKNVKAIVSDCAYSNAYEVVKNISDTSIIFSLLPTLRIFDWTLKLVAGFSLSDIDVVQQIQKCNVPILFIHGTKDTFVPFYMQEKLFQNCPQNLGEKFVVQGASHGASLFVAKEKYIQTVQTFLNKYITE